MVYIVSYDLKEPGQRYSELVSAITSYRKWARLGQSAYLIVSVESAVELRDKFKQFLDSNDKLYVGIVNPPAAWVGMSDNVSQWIKDELR